MLKLLTGSVIILFTVFLGYSQTTEQKVEDFLGEQKYSTLKTSNSKLLDFLRMKVNEGYVVAQAIEEKEDSYTQINHVFFQKNQITINEFIQALNSNSFNILQYTFPNQDSNITHHYLLGDTNILLTVYANGVINRKLSMSQ